MITTAELHRIMTDPTNDRNGPIIASAHKLDATRFNDCVIGMCDEVNNINKSRGNSR